MQAVCDAQRRADDQLRATPAFGCGAKGTHFDARARCGFNVNKNKKTC
jgi:hypothetical protein